MIFRQLWLSAVLLILEICTASGQSSGVPLVRRQWFEIRTAHFNVFSCGTPEDVRKLAVKLEQFCESYSLLAGAQAVESPPVVVMAFPDEESMQPFLPLYQGKPANLAGFFQRGEDENLIVLALQGTNSALTGMEVIFHEYTHLLMRRNDQIWPLWLKEGMAEIYSTFEMSGGYHVLIAQPIDHHLELMAHEPLMPLTELFAVNHNSSQYNERTRQGIFYAESWLLTDFLMAGDNPAFKARFGQFTELLRQGEPPEEAFTNALRTTLPEVEAELRAYLQRGQFTPVELTLPENISAPAMTASSAITPVLVYFRLGDELMRIGRFDEAELYFRQAQKLAPASPLPYEGLGLLAAERDQPDEAVNYLKESLQRGSTSFLTHYVYASEKYQLTADLQNRYAPLRGEAAAEIRDQLQKSIALMPNFGPSHELLGFFEMVQGENLPEAERQLQLAVQLEPENPSCLFSLAQAQFRNREPAAARRSLEPLLLPYVDAPLRQHAAEMMQEINRAFPAN
ncbi:MAG TPA: tetratricopeptide repeat protein [Candidatus Aquilonibacter sp.]|nr:tetratricopeptide repeat protein [Candidatus Aquilonibacter sp.]